MTRHGSGNVEQCDCADDRKIMGLSNEYHFAGCSSATRSDAMSNPDSPVKQLYDLLHQYIPENSLPRALACLQQIGEVGNGDWAPMLRAWRDATGCSTPFDAKRPIAEIGPRPGRKL